MNKHTYTPADHWMDCLLDANELRFPVVSDEKHAGKITVETPVSQEQLLQVKEIAGNKELNVLKLFIGGLGILLSRYTSQPGIVIAMPPMLLPDVDVSKCGTLYCKLSLQEELLVNEFFAQVHEAVTNAYINSEYDDAAFAASYSLRKGGDLLPLKGAAFNYHSLNAQGAWLNDHMLVFELIEGSNALIRLTSKYPSLPEKLLQNLAESLLHLVLNFPANKNKQVSACNIVTPNDLAAWQQRFDNNQRDYPKDLTVIDFFLQQVKNNPAKTAVINGNTSLTYQELDEQSMRISNFITARSSATKDLLIGVMMGRSYMLVAAVLGILRAGAAYIPVDKDYPDERIRDIAADAGCPIIFTDVEEPLVIDGCEFICVDSIDETANVPASLPKPNDLAYVMYSSGTTGRPKGIMVEHAAILNLLFWYNERYAINEDTRIVQLTNIVIDIAFQEIFSALMNGLTLYVPGKEESQDKKLFINYLERHRINFIQLIPDTLAEYLADGPRLKSLDLVLCGGDKLGDNLKDTITVSIAVSVWP